MKTLTPYFKGRPEVIITYRENDIEKTLSIYPLSDDTMGTIKAGFRISYPNREFIKAELKSEIK
jgi:hypothetical protein